MHARGTPLAPFAFRGHENSRLGGDEGLLLVGHQLDHSPAFLEITERGEDFSSDAKIGVIHVRTLHSFGKTERHAPKFRNRHRAPSGRAAASTIETNSPVTGITPRHSKPALPSSIFHSAALRSLPTVTASIFMSLINRCSSAVSARSTISGRTNSIIRSRPSGGITERQRRRISMASCP